MAQSSLSDLCSICYIETPKYRCPRCKTQTCSLSCYKKHQQRASCNGKRDPAAYLKKSQLATPSSIDRDYNYLKGVERSIDGASSDVRERGVKGRGQRGHERGGAFWRYLFENGITVDYAPRGMSRQKFNQSRVTKHGHIFWTIEWVDGAGEQELRHNAPGSDTLKELYKGVRSARRKRKAKAEADGMHPSQPVKKPKISTDVLGATSEAPLQADQVEETFATSPVAATGDVEVPSKETPQPQLDTPAEDGDYFYLLKTATSTPSRVLIPLDPDTTLTQALHGKTVQEYPTIYVLPNPPNKLPAGFTSSQTYGAEVQQGGRTSNTDAHASHTALKPAECAVDGGDLDPNAILDMLKRDVRT